MNEVTQFLALLDLTSLKAIAGGLELSRNRNLPELRVDIERACDSRLDRLIRKGVLTREDWNEMVEDQLFGDPRSSFDDIRAEIRDRLHPINRLRPETVSNLREEPRLLREAAAALRISDEELRRLLAPYHGSKLVGTIRDELLAKATALRAVAAPAPPTLGHSVPMVLSFQPASSPTPVNPRPTRSTSPVSQRFFLTSGVWPIVERFLRALPAPSEIIWVTFSFEAPPRLLQLLSSAGHRVRVLCRHPRAGVVIQRRSLQAWNAARLGQVFGLKTREGEDEEESPGPLHAKAILANTRDGHRGLIGSFNLAETALSRNTESIAELGDDAVDWWQEAVDLLRGPFVDEIREEDCADEEGSVLGRTTIGRDVVIRGAPARLAARTAPDEVAAPSVNDWDPIGLGHLRSTLDDLMATWPPTGASQGWQQKTFRRLWRNMGDRRAEVLFLPVGVGKTFIALRWLLEHFDRTALDERACGLFLAPNEWVARSVERDVAHVVTLAQARASTDDAKRSVSMVAASVFDVRRPSEVDVSKIARLKAAVVDECHNWSDGGSAGTALSYRSVVDSIRSARSARLLGLSATPCRMEHGRFDVLEFLQRFRGEASAEQRAGTTLTLRDAIDQGLLARFRVKRLLRGPGREKVEALLQGDDAVVAMGDYHLVVLRDVWSILMAYQRQLLDELEEALRSARRVLVFVPPVGQDADSFVAKLGKRVRQVTGRRDTFFDFRDRADSDMSARAIFERFRDTPVAHGRPAVLVTVNRFSEGVSINDIDTLVFLRATLSPRVAVQALGRGLRLDPQRPSKVCTVYDAVCFSERLELWEEGAAEHG